MNTLNCRTLNVSILARVILVFITSMVLQRSMPTEPVSAQEATGTWTTPIAIAETDGRLTPGAMAGDSQGNLHVLFTHTPDETLPIGIDYMYWNGNEWSTPVNVLLDPNGANASLPRLVIDRNDTMHVVWHSGAYVYHAMSPVAAAGSADSWSRPNAIGDAILTPIGLATGPHDELYVAYSDSSQVGQVSLVTSMDRGESWSEPVTVAQTPPDTVPGDVQLAMDVSGRLHVTWTVYALAEGNAALGIYYSHNVGNEIGVWETPLQVAEQRHGQAGIVTIGENEVHLVWRSNIGGDGTFHQWSNDGGTNWFNSDRFDDRGGFSGLAYLVVDSLNRVHYTIGPAYYTMWSEGRLEPYVDVATEEVRKAATVSMGEGAILSITRGNRLHTIFHTDFTQLWYTSKLLPVPETIIPTEEPRLSTVESGQPAQPSSVIDALEPLSDPTAPPGITPSALGDSPQPQPGAISPVLLGIVPVILLVVSVLFFNLTRRRR